MTDAPDQASADLIRKARGRFVAMAATYGLGVFNDSFYRQSAMLLAVLVGLEYMQGWVMAVFTVPYLLFAAQAGWLADRFPKRRVVIGSKALELVAMLAGAAGILTGSWPLILTMAFTMGLQSCLFSPALNGAIPELYPDAYVTRANARLKVVVTLMILAGVSLAGMAVSCKDAGWSDVAEGRWIVAGVVVGVSLLGLLISFGVTSRPAASPEARFPWNGPLETVRQVAAIGDDALLRVTVGTNVFVWSVGSLLVPLVNVMTKDEFHRDESFSGYFIATEFIGVALGGLIGGRLATGRRWYRLLAPGTTAMAVLLALMPSAMALPESTRTLTVFALMAAMGIAGGLVLIPCEAFIQTRPPADHKGRVIAAANCLVFCGIFLSGPAASGLTAVMSSSDGFLVTGLAALPVAVWLWLRLGRGTLE